MTVVTESAVKELIKTSLDLTPFMQAAALLVAEDLAGSGLTVARKQLIELYLAAHFTAVSEERGSLKSIKIGESEESFGGDFTTGLGLTRFGQMAILFDVSGTLSNSTDTGKKAQFQVI